MSNNTVRRIPTVTFEDIVVCERLMAEAAYPGEAVELTSANKLQKVSSAGADHQPIILRCDFGQGKEPSEAVAADNKGFGWVPRRGERGYVRLEDGQDISIGEHLKFTAAGRFQTHGGTGKAICVAMEAESMADSSGAETDNDEFILVEFL